MVHLNNLKAPKKQDAKSNAQSPQKITTLAPEARDASITTGESSQPSIEPIETKPPRVPVAPDALNRQRYAVFVRQTNEGIEEVDKRTDNGALKQDGTGDNTVPVSDENQVPIESTQAENEHASKRIDSPSIVSAPSTANDWQSYAGNQMARPDSHEVGPKRAQAELY